MRVLDLTEGDMAGSGVYGIAVLSFFSSGISVILILMCGLAVSSSPSVCGFSSLWLRYSVKEDPSRYCGTVHWALLSRSISVEDFRLNGNWIHNFWHLHYDEICRTSNDLAFRSLYRSIRDLLTFSREGWGWFLAYTCTHEVDTTLSKRHRS